ncbi:MAG: hypothetical protein L0215_07060 [Gemmataceae bacterium]|nr:hypothetical protein [Gemmataceae bacterium]
MTRRSDVVIVDFRSRSVTRRATVLKISSTTASPNSRTALLFGNLFRPVAADPTWLTAAVVELARTIYDERAFDRLPKLADALEQAGCTHAGLLAHLRQPGEHVRGCWAVDLLLGQE